MVETVKNGRWLMQEKVKADVVTVPRADHNITPVGNGLNETYSGEMPL